MLRVPAHHRPHYPPMERLAILELRAARGWSLAQTASRLHVTTATVSSWMRRLNEDGPGAIVQLREPVNKFPVFVAYIVQRLKVLCPSLGYGKIAQLLCRAGLHLGTTTVRRMLRKDVPPEPVPEARKAATKMIAGRYPSHVWHCDLTTVPTSLGFWTSCLPFAFPQRWPFCWWVAVVADHYSRRIMGFAVFEKQPTSIAVRAFLAQAMREAKAHPRYFITDQGRQFRARAFRAWSKHRGIRQRFGAVGQFGSMAVIERLIQTIKCECTRRLLVPYSKSSVRRELSLFSTWYNRERPHERLAAATPDEVYGGVAPAFMNPRFEPRRKWPGHSPCATPQAKIQGRRGVRLDLHVRYLAGRKHLPIVTLKRVA